MTFTADGKRQRFSLVFYSFLVNKSHKNRKVSLTIHSKYKYFNFTLQRAEDRRQKFHFCRLPQTSCLTSLLTVHDPANGAYDQIK